MAKNFNEPEDLLSDESFLAWYFKIPGKEQQQWDSWMSGHPEQAQLVQQAISLLEATRLPELAIPMQQIASAEERLMKRIDATGPVKVIPLFSRRGMIAASVAILLAASLIVIAIRSSKGEAIKTAFGEIARRQLPDGTEVMMDANSSISFAGNWEEGTDREVWMDGEAFFHVRKTRQNSRFVVHLDHADVIVTGTKFNVINRHGAENIMLEEGSVILRGPNGRQLQLSPGEFVDLRENLWEKKAVQRDSLMAWKDQKLVFDGTPLRELVTIINDHYGVHIKLADSSIGDQTISAILPNNNLEVLLRSLEATAEFDISKDGDQIIIRARSARK
ncbi:MAG TPA: FecR domain-containing protein [Puia sp.]|nr:FecR domain-containing protein [Puia sp.]